MIEISEPLSESKIGFRTRHDILLNGKRMGYVDVAYMQKEDINTFQKYTKRRLKVGQPFGVQIFIDATKGDVRVSELGREGLREIVETVKGRFSGLEERDIYILELDGGKKNIIGRASNLT